MHPSSFCMHIMFAMELMMHKLMMKTVPNWIIWQKKLISTLSISLFLLDMQLYFVLFIALLWETTERYSDIKTWQMFFVLWWWIQNSSEVIYEQTLNNDNFTCRRTFARFAHIEKERNASIGLRGWWVCRHSEVISDIYSD